ncbi:hypothetical protein Leryth_026488 [Lithospermum erythrorhizon]|nr:hypothetical protein Leryth_026488 [Lithospermum erythrorhizon]
MKDEMVVTESVGASYFSGLNKQLDLNVSLQPANANGRSSKSFMTNLSSGLFLMPPAPSGQKRPTGRPPGSGRVQQLALVGKWMVSSAGKAFMPHAIYVDEGEDVATKIRCFVKKNRALCILSACGSVSAVTLQLPSSSKGPVTYEGRFDIVCLSGSYLPAKTGSPRNRTGGVSISLSDPVGQVVGGAIGGKLIAATPVQVIAFSFTYDGKQKNKFEAPTKTEISSDMKSSVQAMTAPSQGR